MPKCGECTNLTDQECPFGISDFDNFKSYKCTFRSNQLPYSAYFSKDFIREGCEGFKEAQRE